MELRLSPTYNIYVYICMYVYVYIYICMYAYMYTNINEKTKRDTLVNEQLNLHEQMLEDQLHPGKPT